MATTHVSILELKRRSAHNNLERLSGLEPPTKQTPSKGHLGDNLPCKVALTLLQQWSSDNASTLKTGIQQQVFGGKFPIQWTNAFFAFMESMGVYLRDYDKVVKAWKLYREVKADGFKDTTKFETAISIYQDANYDIDVLAHGWNMDFCIFCDLVDHKNKDHQDWDGAFCGAFFTTDAQKTAPFIGLAFKGTKPTNKAEVLVDENYGQVTGKELGHTHCSNGVYEGLFGTFDTPDNPPYADIRSQTIALAQKLPNSLGQSVRIHVTGHSLGGSYSSFCYTKLLIDIAPNKMPISIGDEYTFGAPRVGSDDYAQLNFDLVSLQAGQSWRIVNNQDIVPQVPPTLIPPATTERLQFHHIDNGVQIFPDRAPEGLSSERGGPWPTPYDINNFNDMKNAILNSSDHSKFGLP
jgi:hypothetical protein